MRGRKVEGRRWRRQGISFEAPEIYEEDITKWHCDLSMINLVL